MGREIADSFKETTFHPMVGIRAIGNFVKGKVVDKGVTMNGNPFLTLSLLDLDGSTTKSVAKGVYEEIDVNVGDLVQVIGSVKQLREKLPQVNVGEVVTITYTEQISLKGGRTLKKFKVEVE